MSRDIWRGRIGRSSCIGLRFYATSCTPGRDISVSLINFISFVIVSIMIVNIIIVVAVLLWIILTILILITMSSTSLVM